MNSGKAVNALAGMFGEKAAPSPDFLHSAFREIGTLPRRRVRRPAFPFRCAEGRTGSPYTREYGGTFFLNITSHVTPYTCRERAVRRIHLADPGSSGATEGRSQGERSRIRWYPTGTPFQERFQGSRVLMRQGKVKKRLRMSSLRMWCSPP